MSSIITSFAAGVLATFVPLFVGLYIPSVIAGGSTRRVRALMAVSSGLIFWFFLDVMNDAVLLDVNQGFGGGYSQVLLIGLFVIGLLLLVGLERFSAKSSRGLGIRISYAVVVLVALGIGFHALGEGIQIGSLLPVTSDIVDAVGGLSAGVAYVFHKFLEGFVIGVFAAVAKTKPGRVIMLGVVSGVPTVIGLVLAVLSPIDSTFFFALGAAAAVYVEFKLIPNFVGRDEAVFSAVFWLLGFYLMYLAGLFHG